MQGLQRIKQQSLDSAQPRTGMLVVEMATVT
jgi:hypothetical protein